MELQGELSQTAGQRRQGIKHRKEERVDGWSSERRDGAQLLAGNDEAREGHE